MTRHLVWIALTVGVCIMGVMAGCKGQSAQTKEPSGKTGQPVEQLVQRLSDTDPLKVQHAASELADAPAGELKNVLPALEAAVKNARNPQVKQALETAVGKAKGG